jgi:nucleoside-diphosphate-sugar epimerase
MTTLVTGATGFIGGHLARRLAREGRVLRCLVRPMSDTSSLTRDGGIELAFGDLGDPGSLGRAMRSVDIVYHAAVDYGAGSTADVRNLLEACVAEGVKRLVYFSSVAAVGGRAAPEVLGDDTPCRPDTDYGRLKRECETMLLDARAKHGLPFVILRPTAVYGPGEVNFWLPLFQAVHSRRVPFFGDGRNLIGLCYVDNLVDAALLAERAEAACGRTYIIADERPYTARELVDAVAEACGVQPPRLRIPRRAAIPMAECLDNLARLDLMTPIVPFLASNAGRWMTHSPCAIARAADELGYRPRVGLHDGVHAAAAWYRQHGFLGARVAWFPDALDAPSLPRRVETRAQRTARIGGEAADLAWRLLALTWRLPPRLVRRARRRRAASRT